MKSHFKKAWLTILLAVGVLTAPAVFANALQFDFDPAGTPSMTALFEDAGPGQVKLTITALALSDNDFFNSVYFNFNPSFDSRNLAFSQIGAIGGVLGSVSTANDSYKAIGGGGKFDINLTFSSKFITGDVVTYFINCPDEFSVNDFLFRETAAAGRSPIYAAGSLQQSSGLVIVQGTPTTQSVPDAASTLGLLILSLSGIGFLSRRFRALA